MCCLTSIFFHLQGYVKHCLFTRLEPLPSDKHIIKPVHHIKGLNVKANLSLAQAQILFLAYN